MSELIFGDDAAPMTRRNTGLDIEPAQPQMQDDTPAEEHLTDSGNAARFARLNRSKCRYCYPLATWLVYDGCVWLPDTTGAVTRLAQTVVRDLYEAASREANEKKRTAIAAWALQAESERRIEAMLRLARADLYVEPEQLDADPWVLNVANGTLDLRTQTLRSHSPDDYLTKITPCAYDQDARSPLWHEVVERAMPDPGVRRFAQKVTGYTLAGVTGEDVMVCIVGPTRTAKGTFQDAIESALGSYAMTAELDLLAERARAGGPRPELVRLRGARMASIYETSRRLRLSASLVKTLAGSDPVTCRDLYGKPITFRPQATLWLATNHRPKAPNDDDALWERIREIPFTATIPEAERDPSVRADLRDPEKHGTAVLAWAIEGCRLWQAEGLLQPDVVRTATADYRLAMDPLQGFLDECCVVSPAAWTTSEDLRVEYERWGRENGERPASGARFRESLKSHGCSPGRRQGHRGWNGVGLTTERSD